MEHVLKEDELMMVTDELGNIPVGRRRLGLYYRDTRYISILEMKMNGQTPRLLASSSDQDYLCHARLANPTIDLSDGTTILARSIHVDRSFFLRDGLRQQISLYSHNVVSVPVQLTLVFGADFYDMLEIRGLQRQRRGTIASPVFAASTLTLSYTGLDRVTRRTDVVFDPKPTSVELEETAHELLVHRTSTVLPEATEAVAREVIRPACAHVTWDLVLEPRTPLLISFDVLPAEGRRAPAPASYDVSLAMLKNSYDGWLQECAKLNTDHEFFNALLRRSIVDLRLLMERTPVGMVPEGGIPWYACVSATDSLIASLQTLMLNPWIAVGTLRFLASWQGDEVRPESGEEPGKIVQEIRKGETPKLGDAPFTTYYGSVDATPLYLMLFAETMKWLDDDALYEELMPSVKRALEWMEQHGDADGDGYLEYQTRSVPRGIDLTWASGRSLATYVGAGEDGSLLTLATTQGYAYRAMVGLAELLRRKGDRAFADRLARKARSLRTSFNRDFRVESGRYFAAALNPQKKPVEGITSASARCLVCGIVDEARAGAFVARLLSRDMACGWGIRTRSSKDPRFNPMSYQDGSIWPDDNSLIIAGMRHYGYDQQAIEIMSQLFQASLCLEYRRLPQLYCGFARDQDQQCGPAEYPVSCSPYATAAGAAILAFQTMLDIRADAALNRLYVNPKLPVWLENVTVEDLRIGKGTVDLRFVRHGEYTSVETSRNEAGIEIVIMPWKRV